MSAAESMEVDQQQSKREENEQEISDTNELIVEEDLNATAEQVEQAEKEKDEPIDPPSGNEDEEMKEEGEKDVKMEDGDKKEVDKEELPSAPENDEDDEEEKPQTSRPSRNAKKAPGKKEEAKKPLARATRGKAKEAPAKPEPKKKALSPVKKATPKKKEIKKEATPEPAVKGGRKRKISAVENGTSSSNAVKKHKTAKDIHVYTDFVNEVPGDRVLSCGEGEQIGHPGRTTTKKPRAIGTLPEDVKVLQVVAGGVHTTILTDKHEVYSCGINEGGTVPVKDLPPEETKDELTIIEFTEEIKKEGNIVQLTSGAGFTAALTDLGSVIAWGNLRDENGAVEVHHLFAEMKKGPTIIIHHKKGIEIVKIAAGENHLVMLSSEGEIYTFGEGSHGQLGSSARTKNIRSTYMADDTGKSLHRSVLEKSKFVKFSNIFAGGYWTMARSLDGRIFACGLNNYGQLGFPLPEEESNGTEGDLEEQNKKLKIDRLTLSPAFPSDKNWTHIAGVKHIVARTAEGEVYGIGLNTDNELGIGTYTGKDDKEHWRYFELQKISFPDDVKIAGITATLGASIAWTDDGNAYGFGYDSVGQLGLGNTDDEEKCVETPQKITSAHLDGYKIISVDLADNHSVFLAAKNN